jgi:hypothetical protein
MSERSPSPHRPPPADIVDWHAGSPIRVGAAPLERAVATDVWRGLGWIIKPGDIVCDWLKVEDADSRGLLRLFVNLTLYAKIAVAIAFLAS